MNSAGSWEASDASATWAWAPDRASPLLAVPGGRGAGLTAQREEDIAFEELSEARFWHSSVGRKDAAFVAEGVSCAVVANYVPMCPAIRTRDPRFTRPDIWASARELRAPATVYRHRIRGGRFNSRQPAPTRRGRAVPWSSRLGLRAGPQRCSE